MLGTVLPSHYLQRGWHECDARARRTLSEQWAHSCTTGYSVGRISTTPMVLFVAHAPAAIGGGGL
jgi:hypothetical protein